MEDREIVERFVAHLADAGRPGLKIDRRPDEENRDSADIDAIAGQIAIEHTSIDSVPNQRRESERFMEAVGCLRDLLPTPEFRLRITIDFTAVTTGQKWPEIRQALAKWILTDAFSLADGVHDIQGVPSVPFELRVQKDSAATPGLFFRRWAPSDDSLSARVRTQLDRKILKLAPYQSNGYTTVLLIENGDIALMDDWTMLEAIKDAYESRVPSGVNQVWYADSSIPNATRFTEFTAEIAN